ncbi:MAG: cyclic nucleotide-binding domain-containing protein [Bacteroidota bacterium]
MKEALANLIRTTILQPDEEEIGEILALFHPRSLAKGGIFKDHKRVCQEVGFIVSGSTRHFALKKNGDVATVKVTQPNNMVMDFISFRMGKPTVITIEALEPTTLLVAPTRGVKKLLRHNLTLNRFIREYMAENMVELGQLHLLFLTGTARERYEFLLTHNPGLLKSIPLRFIASIIGITPTQLSRIRKKRSSKSD